jgi:agmatine deiminase
VEQDRADDNYAVLQENLTRLRARRVAGKPLRVVELPMPAPVQYAGQRLPASYANFYIANRCVLAPVFGDPNDRVALNTLARLFPGREVIGVYSRDLVLGLGTLHCMTMQEPAG